MIILISPAKSLNFDEISTSYPKSEILFKNEAWEIAKTLKRLSPKDLSKLMTISEKLADLNWNRNQDYELNFNEKNPKQALFAFDGEVYNGIDAPTLAPKSINYLQNHLRILSGQYGLLRPLDLIIPYRLEMGTKLQVNGHKNLYEFWGESITQTINSELINNDYVINLASNEYFKSVKENLINANIVTPIFKDYKNGQLKTISFYAKKARGLMVRYLSENPINGNIDNIKNFDLGGYRYNNEISDEKSFIFSR